MINEPTSRNAGAFYPSEVVEDPVTHLPSHIELRIASGDDMLIALDYKVIDGHWVITHGQFSGSQHVAFLNFKVIADIAFDDIAFPAAPPDPRLTKSPEPSATSPGPEPTPSVPRRPRTPRAATAAPPHIARRSDCSAASIRPMPQAPATRLPVRGRDQRAQKPGTPERRR